MLTAECRQSMQSKFCFHCLLTTGLGRLAKVAITLGWRISCLCAHCKGVRHVFRFVQCGRAVKQHHEHLMATNPKMNMIRGADPLKTRLVDPERSVLRTQASQNAARTQPERGPTKNSKSHQKKRARGNSSWPWLFGGWLRLGVRGQPAGVVGGALE